MGVVTCTLTLEAHIVAIVVQKQMNLHFHLVNRYLAGRTIIACETDEVASPVPLGERMMLQFKSEKSQFDICLDLPSVCQHFSLARA